MGDGAHKLEVGDDLEGFCNWNLNLGVGWIDGFVYVLAANERRKSKERVLAMWVVTWEGEAGNIVLTFFVFFLFL